MIKQDVGNKDLKLPQQSHAVIILASGLSQRLGQPKQLLKKQSQPLLEVMTNLALATNPSTILLVVASSQSETIQLSQTLAAQHDVVMPVINSHPEQGMAHSLSLAITQLNREVANGLAIQRVIILGVDQVLLDISHLSSLLAGFNADKNTEKSGDAKSRGCKKVVASSYSSSYKILENELSHIECPITDPSNTDISDNEQRIIGLPINIDYQLLIQWQPLLNGDKGLRHLIRGLSSEDLGVVNNIKLSLDIDTPEQLQFAIEQGWLDP